MLELSELPVVAEEIVIAVVYEDQFGERRAVGRLMKTAC